MRKRERNILMCCLVRQLTATPSDVTMETGSGSHKAQGKQEEVNERKREREKEEYSV